MRDLKRATRLIVTAAAAGALGLGGCKNSDGAKPTRPVAPTDPTAAPPQSDPPLDARGAVAAARSDATPVNRVELLSGLVLEDLVLGTGDTCLPKAVVTIHFKGSLRETGTVFDSTYDRGAPETHPLGNMIRGLREGVPGMRVGGKRRLTIPSDMAYGFQGRRDANKNEVIPPDSDIVFEIELLGVKQTLVPAGAAGATTPPAEVAPGPSPAQTRPAETDPPTP